VSDRIVWLALLPMLAAAAALITWIVPGSRRQRDISCLSIAAAGLVVEIFLVVSASGRIMLPSANLAMSISPPAKLVLLAANGSLISAIFLASSREQLPHDAGPLWATIPALLTSSLLAGALTLEDRLPSIFCLLGAGLAVSAAALGRPRGVLRHGMDEEARAELARRMAGGLKQVAVATIGTVLLIAGVLLVQRYGFRLEDRPLLQAGLGLMAVGLMVRAGVMPFSASASDLVVSSPGAAVLLLGAVSPVVLVTGLLLLSPIEGSLRGSSMAWLGVAGALLAGVRALGASRAATVNPSDRTPGPHFMSTKTSLIAATIALQSAWALFGVLSGSRTGAVGSVLLVLNLSLAVSLLVAGQGRWNATGRWAKAALAVGTASMLGLPPLGGFVGTLLVAQAAANSGGIWLGLMLLGSALTATAWVSVVGSQWSVVGEESASTTLQVLTGVLIATQLGLFVASGAIAAALQAWANIPWLSNP
jgi:hypothetical protein